MVEQVRQADRGLQADLGQGAEYWRGKERKGVSWVRTRLPGGTSHAWLNLPKNDETKNHLIPAEAMRWTLPCSEPAASS